MRPSSSLAFCCCPSSLFLLLTKSQHGAGLIPHKNPNQFPTDLHPIRAPRGLVFFRDAAGIQLIPPPPLLIGCCTDLLAPLSDDLCRWDCDLVMEPSDLNTHLPPRKRLLAGFRTAAAASCDAEPEPLSLSPLVSGDLAARLRGLMGSPANAPSSPEEIIQAARSAADAAADAAAAARAAAADKAAVAAKARAAARSAMELLDSLCRAGASRNAIQLRAKSRKKHVQVKLLYKPNGRIKEGNGTMGDAPRPRRRKESDEEIARKLHRVMNSSPRISFTGPKRPRTAAAGKDGCPSEGGGDACNGSSTHAPIEVAGLINGCPVGKSSERTVQFSKIEDPDDGEDFSRNTTKSRDIAGNGVAIGNLSAGRKVKIKRKQLLLNHHTSKETEEPKETEPSIDSIGYDELKSNDTEKRVSLAAARAPGDGSGPMKITSLWKFKKFKASHCSSDSKMLHNACSSTSAAETSASVKAD